MLGGFYVIATILSLGVLIPVNTDAQILIEEFYEIDILELISYYADLLTEDWYIYDILTTEVTDSTLQYVAEFLLPENLLEVGYMLFTPNNTEAEYDLNLTNESLSGSPFDATLPTKILVHGYNVSLSNSSVFFKIKDSLLKEGDYNVIVVDYTTYNSGTYIQTSGFGILVGLEIAKLIQMLTTNKGVKQESFHIIGHGLGGQVASYAGKATPNLGRITGLDTTGVYFQYLPRNFALTFSDAIFVDSIHTNGAFSILEGYGTYLSYADSDFFPNGGSQQPGCSYNDTYLDTDGNTLEVATLANMNRCSHDRAPYLFLASIQQCNFSATLSDSYEEFLYGSNPDVIVTPMGLHTVPFPDLGPYSMFFLNTTDTDPYCKNETLH